MTVRACVFVSLSSMISLAGAFFLALALVGLI